MIEDGIIQVLKRAMLIGRLMPAAAPLHRALIDIYCHPVFGDWTPRQNQIGWIEMNVNGAVTSFISAGEVHLPGRPQRCRWRESIGDGCPALL